MDRVGEDRVAIEALIGDGGIDAGDVHPDDAPRAKVEVADLGVTHLAIGQADVVVAGAEECVRVVDQEFVVDGLAGQSDGVAVGLGAIAPAVEDGEDDGFRHMQVSG